jgi:hypothetical protein
MPRSFKLLETLGEGAFGAVHLAEIGGDEGFVQRLAVKWLHPQWSHDAELAGRLRDEARLLALLNHDHIVRVHGLTHLGGRLAILMEPVDGVDLSRLGPEERVPPRAAAEILSRAADALDAAWQTVPPGGQEPLRVVHRDIKPSNLMVSSRGGVKVLDFGVARARFDAREAQTRSQQYGTARYMAPERWLEGIADAPSDVFSLGVTLLEIVGGHPVERPRLAREGFEEDMKRALAVLDDCPPLRELAARMTAYAPAERPTAAEIVGLGRELRDQLPGPGLREWAPGFVARNPRKLAPGALDGTVVQEDASAETFDARVESKGGTGPAPVPPTGPLPNLAPQALPKAALVDAPAAEAARTRVLRNVGWGVALFAAALLVNWGMSFLRPVASLPEIEESAIAPALPPAPPEPAAAAEPTVAEISPEPEAAPKAERKKPKLPAQPAVADAAPAAAPAKTTVLKFRFDDRYSVTAPGGRPAKNQGGLEFAVNEVIELTIQGGGLESPATCTVKADPSKTLVDVDPTRSPICVQGQGR